MAAWLFGLGLFFLGVAGLFWLAWYVTKDER